MTNFKFYVIIYIEKEKERDWIMNKYYESVKDFLLDLGVNEKIIGVDVKEEGNRENLRGVLEKICDIINNESRRIKK